MVNLTSIIILVGLLVFWGTSLLNVFLHRTKTLVQTKSPMSLEFLLALFGTLFMFAETIAYIASNLLDNPGDLPGVLSTFGLILFLSGSFLHAWSVNIRGKNSVSWTMPKDHELIMVAPYSLVRHPSYLGYMLMIIGITLIWRMWLSLLPWVAIPGYYMVSRREEQLLINKFGDEYIEYMKRVGGFIPKILKT